MILHTIAQGECMTMLAHKYGFVDPATIYNDGANAELRKARPNMHVLFPGDVVAIPSRTKQVACATGAVHQFRVKRPTKKLVIVLLDGMGEPMSGIPYKLIVEGAEFEGTTGGDGKIEHVVDVRATKGALSLCGRPPMSVGIGHLNPMDATQDGGVTGVQARLRNLGYDPGQVDGRAGRRTRAAVRRFQMDTGLQPTGEIDTALIDALGGAHGC
jgi:hypothetical protein